MEEQEAVLEWVQGRVVEVSTSPVKQLRPDILCLNDSERKPTIRQ